MAYQGALVLDKDGEFHTIPAGRTYRVTMDLEPAAARGDQDSNRDSGVVRARRRKLYFDLVLVGAIGVGSYFIWREVTESPSLPK